MVIGVVAASISIPEARSLKDKRFVLLRLHNELL